MGKFLFSDVKKYFNDSGYELVTGESEYKNSENKIEYICPKHGIMTTTFASFKRGARCRECATDKHRTSYDTVKREIESKGYKLLEDKYVNATTKLLCLCPKHGEFKITYSSIKTGYGCQKCGIEKNKIPYEVFKNYVESIGYKLLDKEYKRSDKKILCLCPKHGEFEITYSNLKKGSGCRNCFIDSMKLSYNTVRIGIEARGYKLLDDTYVDSRTKLLCLCPKHGKFKITYSDIHSGYGCKKCGIDKRRGKLNYNWKGGVTPLLRYLRPMLNPWVQQQLQRTNYTCEITGKQGTLNVHHMVSFKKIFKITMKELHMDIRENIGDYSEDELQLITVNLMKNNDLYANPIVMLQSVHQEFHQFCGGNHKETTMEKLKEFTEYYRQHNSLEEL